jgi:lambda family phage tail tape measure protein
MANIARLGVALGLNSAEFVTGIAAAGKKLEEFASKAAGYGKVAATAFVAATVAAMAYADEIADVAKANDVAIDSVIKLQNALANSGGSAENAGKLLSSFSKFVDDAAGGSFEAQQKLAKMGVTLKDIGNLSTDTLFQKTIKGLAEIEDPLTRSARGMDAFGKAGKGVDWVGVAEGMASGAEASKKQAKAIEDAAAAFDMLKQAGRDVNLLIAETLGPSLKLTAEYIKGITDGSNLLGNAFKIVFQTVAVLGSDLQFIFQGISDEISHTIENIKILTTEGIKAAIAANEAYEKRRQQARADLDLYQARIMGIDAGFMGKGFDDPRISQPATSGRQVTPGIDTKAEALKKASLAKEFEIAKLRLENNLSMTNLFLNEQQKIEQEYNQKNSMAVLERNQKDINEEYKFKELNSKIYMLKELQFYREAEEKRKQLKFKNMAEEAKYEMELQDEAGKATAALDAFYVSGNVALREKQELEYIALNRAKQMFVLEQESRYIKTEDFELAKEMLEIQFKHEDAIKAINADDRLTADAKKLALLNEIQYQEKLIEYAKQKNQILKDQKEGGFMEGFEDKMNRFGKNMKTAFEAGGEAFDSVMSSMERGLEQFVTTGKINFADFAGSIIKDMLRIQLRQSASNLFSIIGQTLFPGKAEGGPVESNSPYIVGERGPELFVPRSAGAIVPNHSMAMMGGSTNITNYNIQAIDTKSFEDRILGSSKAVWAANAYGAKNLSLGRGRT